MTRLLARGEISMTRTKFHQNSRIAIAARLVHLHVNAISLLKIQRPARIHEVVYQIETHTSRCISCQLTRPASDKQYKVKPVARLSKLQRTINPPTICNPESHPARVRVPCSRIRNMFCYAEPLQGTRWSKKKLPFDSIVTALTSWYAALWTLRWVSTDMV